MPTPPAPSIGLLRIAAIIALASLATAHPARADEGMWTMDNLPGKQMQARYGFTPSAEWIKRVTQSSARLALGCSASFVSGDGLVMTNHHCANECLSQLSTAGYNAMQVGYSAASQSKEPRCPAMELDRLDSITDVSMRMSSALSGKQAGDYVRAQQAAESGIEHECVGGDATTWRCDVVTLYHGGRTALYRYRRYQDVRLVFAPDQDAAFFGGDPDNFNFPRYDLDVTFLRAYDGGHPVHTEFFPFDPAGPKEGELVFTSGNPGSTSREAPVAQLRLLRDLELPATFGYLSTLDGVLWEYGRAGPGQLQDAQDQLFSTENSLKVYTGWMQTLADPQLLMAKQKQEDALRGWIDADPQRRAQFGDPWARLAPTLDAERRLYPSYVMIEGGRRSPRSLQGDLFGYAKLLVRGAAERAKPDAERLSEYHDSRLPAIEAQLGAAAPVHPQLEQTLLAYSLGKLRQSLGADDEAVRTLLGKQSPDAIAAHLVGFTHLGDPKVRLALWQGGQAAIDASKDPMIVLARQVEPIARRLRDAWDREVVAPQRQASELLARARFARDGTSVYPDATFTQRLSYGIVKGWDEDGKPVPAFTHFAGLYDRATGSEPFMLSKAWLDAKPHLDLDTPFDFASTNDIIGGNSGSPVIDAQGHAVGLVFDGNIHSLGGDFTFDGTRNRAVSVDTAALLEALKTVYRNQGLANELLQGHI